MKGRWGGVVTALALVSILAFQAANYGKVHDLWQTMDTFIERIDLLSTVSSTHTDLTGKSHTATTTQRELESDTDFLARHKTLFDALVALYP